jgi:SulP family sulfate permease
MAQAAEAETRYSLRDEFRPDRLLPSLTAGVLMGLAEAAFAISLVSLIFTGELAPYLPQGIGIALASAVVLLITTALVSAVPGVMSSVQDSPAVLMAVIAGALAGTLVRAGVEDVLPTVLVALALSTLLTGMFLLLLGFFNLGGLVRYVPYPVVGGFLAGTGWLLAQGSFGTMADYPLTLATIPDLLRPDQLVLWVPGIVCALVLFVGVRSIKHFLAMPGLLLAAVLVFYLGLLVTGTSFARAADLGLLLGKVGAATWQPFNPALLLAADWSSLFGQSGNVAILLALTLVSVMLNVSSLELAINHDVDVDRELRSAGFANVVSGLLGGMAGYHWLSLTTLSYRIGARGRLAGIVAGLLAAVILFIGGSLLSFIPRPLLGGLLLFLGLDFLIDWVVGGWSRFSRAEYGVVLLILVVIMVTNFLIGVGVGLVAMVILFAVNYSQISVVHHSLAGAETRSNVERSANYRRALVEYGEQTYVLELQGFIFFGTSNALLEQIRARVNDPGRAPVRFVILDFRRVTGLDSSAALSFSKGRQLAKARGIMLVLTDTSEATLNRLELGSLSEDDEDVKIFPDLDRGLEWCEDQILDIEGVTRRHVPTTLRAQLAESGFETADTKRLMDHLEQVKVKEGEYLIRQGDEPDDLYFIELGRVSIYLELGDDRRVRLRTLGMGTAVGELGLYLDERRSASVIADMPSIAHRLTRQTLDEMRQKDPELAAAFHELIIRLVSERLAAANRSIEALHR